MIRAIIFDCYGVLVRQDLLRRKVVNEELFGWIKRNRRKYVFAILSNIERSHLDKYLNGEQQSYFSAVLASSEIGRSKPDPEAYKITAARLNMPTKHCLFVDDIQANVMGAEATGMKGIVYKNFAQFEADVQKLLD